MPAPTMYQLRILFYGYNVHFIKSKPQISGGGKWKNILVLATKYIPGNDSSSSTETTISLKFLPSYRNTICKIGRNLSGFWATTFLINFIRRRSIGIGELIYYVHFLRCRLALQNFRDQRWMMKYVSHKVNLGVLQQLLVTVALIRLNH